MRTVVLDGEADWPGFRSAARALLAGRVPPDAATWHTAAAATPSLFARESSEPNRPPAPVGRAQSAMNFVVPAAFIRLAETAVLHADPARFALLYRLLWRLVHEPGLRHDPLDADRLRVRLMAQAVRRDLHKMKAFVRFRTLPRDGQSPLHVAWFEPFHHIVAAAAPFFVRRFTTMHWAILTPESSARWTPGDDARGPGRLEFGPGAHRADAPPPDAGEALWLTYYTHIFNPARLKLDAMRKEMPRKYWPNLPEAPLIAQLALQSAERTGRMVDAAPTVPTRRIPAAPIRLVRRGEPPHGAASDSRADVTFSRDTLKQAVERCRDCAIGAHATQAVMGEGPAGATLMVVGEQPGDREDLVGRPFVGPAGQLFDRAALALGWSRERLFVTNAVKHFKFELRGKRRMHKTPGQREAAACLHWLEAEIVQVRPKAFLALGATAAQALLGYPVSIAEVRGRWLEGPAGRPVLVTLHPAALLRMEPGERDVAWQAWLKDLSLASALAKAQDHAGPAGRRAVA